MSKLQVGEFSEKNGLNYLNINSMVHIQKGVRSVNKGKSIMTLYSRKTRRFTNTQTQTKWISHLKNVTV